MNVTAINFASNQNFDSSNSVKGRVSRMLMVTTIGAVASSLFYMNKYAGKKLFLRSLETGALAGLTADIFCSIISGIKTKTKDK